AMPPYILDMSKLTKLLDLKKDKIEEHTFIPMYLKFLDEYNERKHRELGITQVINRKVRKFCSLCIKERSGFKLKWQINDIDICEIHEIKLQTKCSHCSTEQPYLNKDTLIIEICFNCGHSLSKYYSGKTLDSHYIEKQKKIIRNYQYINDPKNTLVNNINSLDKEQSLAITLLYIMNGEKNE